MPTDAMPYPLDCYALACTSCGEGLDSEETVTPHREGIYLLCDNCWYGGEDREDCAWCSERVSPESQHRYIAVYKPGAAWLGLPGLYRIERWPYYTDVMISAWLHASALTWIGYLPVQTGDGYGSDCGHFCEDCQQKALDHITYTARCSAAALAV